MQRKIFSWFILLLAILCLLAGCEQAPNKTEPSSGAAVGSTAPDLSGLFDEGSPASVGLGFG